MSCSLACMAEHNDSGKSFYDIDLTDNKNESRNFVALDKSGRPVPIFCRHCDEPECVAACMSGAMTKDKETGVVSYNPDQCASCFMCVMSCPYGVLKTDEKAGLVVVKCDFCNGRETPRCVESCANRAIYVVEVSSL